MGSELKSKNENSQQSNVWIKKEQHAPLLLLKQPHTVQWNLVEM